MGKIIYFFEFILFLIHSNQNNNPSSVRFYRKPISNELLNPNLWQAYSPSTTAHIQIGNVRNNRDPTVSMSKKYFTERINFWKKNAPI